jgi:hypothetical protein
MNDWRWVSFLMLASAACGDGRRSSSTSGAPSSQASYPIAPSNAAPEAAPPAPSGSSTIAQPDASVSSSAAQPGDAGPPPSWLGVSVDGAIDLPRSMEFAGGKIRLPSDWKTLRIQNGMAETDDGVFAYLRAPPSPSKEPAWGPVEKDAVIILTTHGAIDDSLLDYGAGARLGLVADAGAEHWSEPTPLELGPKHVPIFALRANGKLAGKPAELWQLRRKVPSAKKGFGWSLLLLGAIRTSASPEARAHFLASLASFTTE